MEIPKLLKIKLKKHGGELHGALSAPLVALLVETVISSAVKGLSGRGGRRAGRGYINTHF